MRKTRQPLTRIFAIPFALGVVSAIGLITALVGDGPWDASGWTGLGIPVVVTVWCLWGRKQAS
jgi:hypothetical protein